MFIRILVTILLFKVLNLQAQFGLPFVYNKYAELVDSTQDIGRESFEMNHNIVTLGEVYYGQANTFGIITSVRDSHGVLLSKHHVVYPNYNSFSILRGLKHSNSSLYGVGLVHNLNDTVNKMDLLFAKFNANGDTLFTKIFHDTGSVYPFQILPYYNNRLLVFNAHAHDHNNAEFSRMNFMVLDTMGNVISSVYSSPSLYGSFLLLQDTLKHELYALGINKSQPGSNFYIENYLRCFNDTNFTLKFTKTNISGFGNDYIQSAIYYQGKFYATFAAEQSMPPSPVSGNMLKLYKMKLNGQVLQKTAIAFNPVDSTGSAGGSNMLVDNGKIIFAGFNAYTGFNLYISDTSLSSPCLARITAPDNNSRAYLNSIGITEGKKISFTGYCTPVWVTPSLTTGHWQALSEDYRVFLENDCGQFVAQPEMEVIRGNVKAYPNPSSEWIWIETESSFENVEVWIYNAMGQRCFVAAKAEEKRIVVDLRELSCGIYFCHLKDSNQDKKIIKVIKAN